MNWDGPLPFLTLMTAGFWLVMLLLRLFVFPQVRPGQDMRLPAAVLAGTCWLAYGVPQVIIALAMLTASVWIEWQSQYRHTPVKDRADAADVLGLDPSAPKPAVQAAFEVRRKMAQRVGTQPWAMRKLYEARDLMLYGQILRLS
jgi:hypothetical protein